jgi:hypothetical protein
MKVRPGVISVVVGLTFTFQFCSAQATSTATPTTAPTTATQKGTAIGQTINAAITAALPAASAVENIIAALFKKPASAVSSNAKTTVSKQEVTDAAKTNADPTALANAAQTQLAALQGAVDEIAQVNTLATAAQTASDSFNTAGSLLFIADWTDFGPQWQTAKQNLDKVTATDPSKLGKISDENVLLAWNTLNGQYATWRNNVDTYSAAKNQVLAITNFIQLAAAVRALAQIPSAELLLISNQLQTVQAKPSSNKNSNNAPPPPPPGNGPLSEFLTRTLSASPQ